MRITPALLLLAASPAFAANYATCILDKMPGTQNDVAASAVARVCATEHPGGNQAAAQGSGRGMFSFKSGAECAAKKAGGTQSNRAASMIWASCGRLYDEATPPWQNLKPFNGKLDAER